MARIGKQRSRGAFPMAADGTLSADLVREIVALREDIREDEGAGGQCGFVVECLVDRYPSLTGVSGVYLAPDGTPVGDHVWCETPDGTVVDPTADQFCEGHDGVRVLLPGDPDRARYRFEWTEDFNPGLVDEYPELASVAWSGEYDMDVARRMRDERGEGWWLPDPSAWREWSPADERDAPATAPRP